MNYVPCLQLRHFKLITEWGLNWGLQTPGPFGCYELQSVSSLCFQSIKPAYLQLVGVPSENIHLYFPWHRLLSFSSLSLWEYWRSSWTGFLVAVHRPFSPLGPTANHEQCLGTLALQQVPQGFGGSCQRSLVPSFSCPLPPVTCVEMHATCGTPDFQGTPWPLLSQSWWGGGYSEHTDIWSDSCLVCSCLLSVFLTSRSLRWAVNWSHKTGSQSLPLQMLLRHLITHSARWTHLPPAFYALSQEGDWRGLSEHPVKHAYDFGSITPLTFILWSIPCRRERNIIFNPSHLPKLVPSQWLSSLISKGHLPQKLHSSFCTSFSVCNYL